MENGLLTNSQWLSLDLLWLSPHCDYPQWLYCFVDVTNQYSSGIFSQSIFGESRSQIGQWFSASEWRELFGARDIHIP